MKWPKPISEEEFNKIWQGMEEAEKNGFFDDMFQGECKEPEREYLTREKLLASISSDMTLRKSFFMDVYSFEISTPGFKDKALKALYDVGCSKAYEHYDRIVSEYEEGQKEGMKRVAKWLREKIDSDYDKQLKEHERKVGKELSKQKAKLTKNEVASRILGW